MKVLVTGATGFVGGHLVDALLARRDTVTALVREPGRAKDLARRGVHLVEGGLADAAALRRACADQEVIYHLAGLVAARSEAEFLATNRDGTASLVTAATAAGASRFLLVSSLAAAGPTTAGNPLTGTEPARPVTRYGRSKLAAEAVVRASGLAWTIVRPPAVYGPGDREMLRIFKAAALGLAPVFGDGSQELSLVYGPDLSEALVAAGTTPACIGGVYYACHPEALTTRRLVELAGASVGRRPVIVGLPSPIARSILWLTDAAARLTRRSTLLSFDKAAEFLAPAWLADPAPLTQATDWSASHDFRSGAEVTVAWYRRAGWL